MTEVSKKTIKQIQTDVKSGNTTCEKLVHDYLLKIEANKHLNAFLEVFQMKLLREQKNSTKN